MALRPSNDFQNCTSSGWVKVRGQSRYHPPSVKLAVVNVRSWAAVYMHSLELRSSQEDKKGGRSSLEIAFFGTSSSLKYLPQKYSEEWIMNLVSAMEKEKNMTPFVHQIFFANMNNQYLGYLTVPLILVIQVGSSQKIWIQFHWKILWRSQLIW